MSLEPLIGRSSEEGDGHWISVSDLMSGLMVIFLFIAISYIQPVLEARNKVRDIVVTWKESEVNIFAALEQEFAKDLPRWGAELDPQTLSIRFKAPDVLFDQGDARLKPEFEAILADFFPRYLRVLNGFEAMIAEVRIEGHTSSAWAGATDPFDAYFRNMDLSQRRTRTVLQYGLQLPAVAPYRDWARRLITANGLSSSQTIRRTDGAEDETRSRRVEFRVVTNSKDQIVRILETVE